MEVDVLSQNGTRSKFDLRASLWDLRDSFTDVTLVCGKEKESIRAHKIILAGRQGFKIQGVLPLLREQKRFTISE